MSDPEVMKNTGFKEPQEDDAINACLNRWTREVLTDYGVWCVEDPSAKKCVAWFMLKMTEFEVPELGFMVSRRYWGQGIATEAGAKLIQHGFEDLNQEGIVAIVNDDNAASIRVLEKLGMSQNRDFSRIKNGKQILQYQSNNPLVKN